MDKCVALLASLTLTSYVSGRSYRSYNYDSHDNFHGYDYPGPHKHHVGHPQWETPRKYPEPHYLRPPHSYTSREKEYWRSHNPDWHSNPGSWEYPDFPNKKYGQNPGHWHNNNPGHWHNDGASNNNWNAEPYPNWNQGLPHKGNQHNQGNGNPNGNWNQGNGNPNGNWNQGGPNWNQGGNVPDQGGNRPNLPNWNNAGSTTGSRPSSWTTTTASPPAATQSQLATALCIRSCPVTSEYNPVCGTNNVTYGNAGRLECARYCGVDVTMQRNSPCPANQNLPSQPNPPNQNTIPPTRFTTIDIPASSSTPATIPQDILDNIFTTQSPPTTLSSGITDDNYDIDIRTRNRFAQISPQHVFPITAQIS